MSVEERPGADAGPVSAAVDALRRLWGLDGPGLELAGELERAWGRGHTGLVLAPERAALLEGEAAVAPDLDGPVRPLVLRGGLLQSRLHAAAEREVARRLLALAAAVPREVEPPRELSGDADRTQVQAARLMLSRGFALVTGGPGTGKTHTAARALALALERDPGLRFALAAPTGKAAQRLGESVARASADPALRRAAPAGAALLEEAGRRSSTLHRLLEWRPGEDVCGRNAERPLELDLLVVDESSMLDLLLWRALLRALPQGCRLAALGDPAQLEAIAPGRVLGTLVEAAGRAKGLKGCWVELERNYRFAARPRIGALAQATRERVEERVLAESRDREGGEVLRWEPDQAEAALDAVWPSILELARSGEAAGALGALDQVRVLCALAQGPWGAAGWNQRIQARLAREGLGAVAWPVLVTANDPYAGLFNGDLGVVLPGRAGQGPTAVFAGPQGPRSFALGRLPGHRAAWAMTVHRSQGSEFRRVLLVLPPGGHELAGPELLYTAVTRARELVLLCADDAALRQACRERPPRVTGLGGWLESE